MSARQVALGNLASRRDLQDAKWGKLETRTYLESRLWVAVLTEELGEVARADLEGDTAAFVNELKDLGAVVVAALEQHYLGTLKMSARPWIVDTLDRDG